MSVRWVGHNLIYWDRVATGDRWSDNRFRKAPSLCLGYLLITYYGLLLAVRDTPYSVFSATKLRLFHRSDRKVNSRNWQAHLLKSPIICGRFLDYNICQNAVQLQSQCRKVDLLLVWADSESLYLRHSFISPSKPSRVPPPERCYKRCVVAVWGSTEDTIARSRFTYPPTIHHHWDPEYLSVTWLPPCTHRVKCHWPQGLLILRPFWILPHWSG